MLFVIAEKEELFDNADHGILAHERAKGPKKLVVVEGIQHLNRFLFVGKIDCFRFARRLRDDVA